MPYAARPALVHALKWIDDRFWGVVKNNRVQWLGYDSGIKPGEHGLHRRRVHRCRTQSQEQAVVGNVGYYAPLKENTNRFVKR